MNKKNSTKTITRTKAVEIIKSTNGRFFTVTFETKTNPNRVINGNYKTGNTTPLGHIKVYSTKDKGYRTVNPMTIKGLSYMGTTYKVK